MSATIDVGPPMQQPPVSVRRNVPIKWWAAAGLFQVALAAYCIVAWAAAGQMTPTDPGPDAMPGWKTACMWILSVGGILATGYCFWRFLLKPWRQERQLTNDGMLLIGCVAMAVPHDIMLAYTSPSFSYNSHYLNAGSWMGQVPGVQTPNANLMPEPLVLVLPGYGWACFVWVLLGCWVMQQIRLHRPGTTTAGLLGVTLAFFFVLDLAFEAILVHIDTYAYTGTIHRLTLLSGSDNQLPLYEVLFWAVFLTGMTSLRFFRDDRGNTFVERGVERLPLSKRKERAVRQLALVGAGSAAITVFYNMPWALISSHNNSFPQDLPSYFVNGVCSPDPANATAEVPPCPNKLAATYRR